MTGENKRYDVVVCATGFDTSFIPRFPVLGCDGLNLQDIWADHPKTLGYVRMDSRTGTPSGFFVNFYTENVRVCCIGSRSQAPIQLSTSGPS